MFPFPLDAAGEEDGEAIASAELLGDGVFVGVAEAVGEAVVADGDGDGDGDGDAEAVELDVGLGVDVEVRLGRPVCEGDVKIVRVAVAEGDPFGEVVDPLVTMTLPLPELPATSLYVCVVGGLPNV
ncbi:MAG: hypothetical protein NVSMB57_08620 [Actinomycetota bacterium]